MNQKTRIVAVALSVLATVAVVAGTTYAKQNGGKAEFASGEGRGFGQNEEAKAEFMKNQEAIREALENGDYETWKELVGERREGQVVETEENFQKLTQMHELRQSGDTEGAQAIAEELGLRGNGFGRDKGHRGCDCAGMNGLADREAIREAIENGDYATWQELVGDSKMGQAVETEEDFQKLVQMHELRQSGDTEGAQAIAEELGLGGRGFGRK